MQTITLSLNFFLIISKVFFSKVDLRYAQLKETFGIHPIHKHIIVGLVEKTLSLP